MEDIVRKILHTKLFSLGIVVVFFIFLFGNLRNLSVDISLEGWLKKDDPVLENYNHFRDTFGRNDVIIIAVQTQDIFDISFLEKLEKFHEILEEKVPHVNSVDGLYNARYTYGEDEDLIIENLSDYWPEAKSDMEAFREKVLSKPLYHNVIINADENMVFFGLRIELYSEIGKGYTSDEEIGQSIHYLETLKEEFHTLDDFRIFIAGSPVVSDVIRNNMARDMPMFTVLSVLMIVVILIIVFRRFFAVVLPIIIVICALLSTFSFMAIFDVPIKLPTQILPSFILSVGICYSLHFLIIFFGNYKELDQKEEAILVSINHLYKVILFTGITTAIGICSFAFSNLSAISEFGIFGSLGIVITTTFVLLLLPLLLSLVPVQPIEIFCKEGRHGALSSKLLWYFTKISINRRKEVFFITILILGATFLGLKNLVFSHYPLHWLPEKSDIRISTDIISTIAKRANSFDVLIDTGKKFGVYDPEFIQKIHVLQKKLNTIPEVGKTISIVDILQEVHKALYNGADESILPKEKKILAEELFLFELGAKSDLEKFVDDKYQQVRISISFPDADNEGYMRWYTMVDKIVKEVFPETKAVVTGFTAIVVYSTDALIDSMTMSYVITGLLVSIIIIALCKGVKLGLFALIPNFTPIIITLGVMGIVNIPVDVFILLIGCIAVSIAIDDTIHFLYHYYQYREEGLSNNEAIHRTLQSSGKAILFTTLILSGGFLIYGFSEITSIVNFGVMTALAMILAFLADIILTPALVTKFFDGSKVIEELKNKRTKKIIFR